MVAAGDAFLVCHGSFNPVHRHHVEIMVQARARLEEAGYRVLAGVLAPTNRSYMVRWKGIAAVTDEHRIAALRLACQEAGEPSGWLYCDERGVDYGSGYKMICRLLEPEFREEHPGAVGFDVKGADVVVRYSAYASQLWYPAVIVARSEATKSLVEGLEQAGLGREGAGSQTFVIEAELPGDYSSTKLREALRRGDEAVVRRMATDQAAEYLISHRRELFLEPFGQDDQRSGAALKRLRSGDPAGPPSPSKGPVRVLFVRSAESRRRAREELDAVPASALTANGREQAASLRDNALLAALPRPLLVAVAPTRHALETATITCGDDDATLVANADLRGIDEPPCDLGSTLDELVKAFPGVDFTALRTEAGLSEEPGVELGTERLTAFARWCSARSEDTIVVFTDYGVCHSLLGVALDHCDAVCASLDRATLCWTPHAYAGANHATLQWTACQGTPEGLEFLAVGRRGRGLAELVLEDGWQMLHYAASSGNVAAVRKLLDFGAEAEKADFAGYTAKHWAEHRGHAEVLKVFDEYEEQWNSRGDWWSGRSWRS